MAYNYLTSPELLFAIITGLGPSLIWLYFWLKRDRKHPEPFGLLFLCFLLGATGVFIAGIIQKGTKGMFSDDTIRVAVWAGIEEVIKFSIFLAVAYKNRFNDEPIDAAIYLITIALGFAAAENTLYVLKPEIASSITAGLLTGGLRFFGSTLLHVIASGFVGIVVGLSPKTGRGIFMLLGLAAATFFHTTFNLYVLRNETASFLQIYGYLWVAAIITVIILEKLNRMEPEQSRIPQQKVLQ